MKRLVIGILAHVDAGKTTLSEALMYQCGLLRRLGRVDHGDALLDSDELERQRGITIFSKQALLRTPQAEIALLDTPGHVDFSAETERTLSVLDYAILVISGTDGVQSHTQTLWQLLERYRVPVFLYVNKMDMAGADHARVMKALTEKLSFGCVDMTNSAEERREELALCDEALMEVYLKKGELSPADVVGAVRRRRVFPCYFGSALKMEGVDALIEGLQTLTREPAHGKSFGARVYKVGTDETGARLTYMKITGGSLRVKTLLQGQDEQGREWNEKIDQLRLYSGPRFTQLEEAEPGMVCVATGLSATFAGQGLGAEKNAQTPFLEPVLTCRVLLEPEADAHSVLEKLKKLEQEDPQLHVSWNSALDEIHLQLMGQVQKEILQSVMQKRYGVRIGFGPTAILYKETIAQPVEGVGHFEPLRHYAEVHLLMQPLPRGSGLQLAARCREEQLDKNWQRLVLTHLKEKTHIGVLTGSPITDMKITLVAGRAHQKHTEGGDFRQATYRAVRQGLRSAQNLLLEPWYDFRLELPSENVGRAMSDIQRMEGKFDLSETGEETALLTGSLPVACVGDYAQEVVRYTRGRGSFICTYRGYEDCHNTDEVCQALGYNPDSDTENPADSVFCSHGSGYLVPWDQVRACMHIDSGVLSPKPEPEPPARRARRAEAYCATLEQDKELLAIFERTYGPIKKERRSFFKAAPRPAEEAAHSVKLPAVSGPEYLLVDGYNMIFSWEELNRLAAQNMDAARQQLMDVLCNYRGFCQCELILVFDAYKVKGNPGSVENYHNISVVYTKEAETADMYIEKVTHQLGRKHRVRVASSDGTEQVIILGQGALRLSAEAFHQEVQQVEKDIREYLSN